MAPTEELHRGRGLLLSVDVVADLPRGAGREPSTTMLQVSSYPSPIRNASAVEPTVLAGVVGTRQGGAEVVLYAAAEDEAVRGRKGVVDRLQPRAGSRTVHEPLAGDVRRRRR